MSSSELKKNMLNEKLNSEFIFLRKVDDLYFAQNAFQHLSHANISLQRYHWLQEVWNLHHQLSCFSDLGTRTKIYTIGSPSSQVFILGMELYHQFSLVSSLPTVGLWFLCLHNYIS